MQYYISLLNIVNTINTVISLVNTITTQYCQLIGQHHDAITGTEKQRVADNYHARLFEGLENSFENLGIDTVLDVNRGGFTFCPLLNISQVNIRVMDTWTCTHST